MEREVGAFEAKTHFSQLLKEVEEGAVIHVTHRGRAVAVLRSETDARESLPVLARIAARRRRVSERESLTPEDLVSFRDEGRRF